jgi:hypothetical protein
MGPALYGYLYHALSGINDAIIVCECINAIFNEGVMGNYIQIMADIIFDIDCLLYLCTPGMGVNLPKERASPCLQAERYGCASVRRDLKEAGAPKLLRTLVRRGSIKSINQKRRLQ